MEKKIKVRKIVDNALWDQFVKNSPHGTVMSTSAWLQAGADAQGGNAVKVGVWDGENLIAGVSYVEVFKGPFKKATTPVLTPYGGFIYNIDSDITGSGQGSLHLLCAEKLVSFLEKNYHYIFLVHTPAFFDIRPFSWQNWNESVRYTYRMDITDTEALWNKFRKGLKSKIRQAEKSVEVGGSISAEQIGEIYSRLYRDRGKISPVPDKLFTSMIKNLIKSGLVKVTSAREINGKIIASLVVTYDEKTIYTWSYGTIPEKNYTGADSLLIWNAIQLYSKTHQKLDMVGANIPSIAFFKKGFGGLLTPYYVTEHYSSPITRTAFYAYAKMRGLFSK